MGTKNIELPIQKLSNWKEILYSKLSIVKSDFIEIDCLNWSLRCKDIEEINKLVQKSGSKLSLIRSEAPETVVSAAALGIESQLSLSKEDKFLTDISIKDHTENDSPDLLFLQKTLRSGEHLEADGNVLLLGDVNPGAKISAGGDVMVWGRLLGIAHAGKFGNIQAKIIALQLRPLQLRIANTVARGPEEDPEPGLTEEARLQSGMIKIHPAKTNPYKIDTST